LAFPQVWRKAKRYVDLSLLKKRVCLAEYVFCVFYIS
jgi:aryl carrier-like protein